MTPQDIISRVAQFYGNSPAAIFAPSRRRDLFDQRVVTAYLLHALGMTPAEIGIALHKHRTSAYYYINTARTWRDDPRINPQAVNAINAITNEIFNQS